MALFEAHGSSSLNPTPRGSSTLAPWGFIQFKAAGLAVVSDHTMPIPIISLLVVADADVDAAAVKQFHHLLDVGLAVVVGEQHDRLNHHGGMRALLGRHRVGQIARQEGHVDVLDGVHLGVVLGVAGDVDAHALDGEYEAVVTALGVELQFFGRNVEGRNGVNRPAVGQFKDVAIGHHLTLAAKDLVAAGIGDEHSTLLAQLVDSHRVKVVKVLVGHQDIISLG